MTDKKAYTLQGLHIIKQNERRSLMMDAVQDVCLFSRRKMTLSGVEEVGNFTEEQILLTSVLGMIAIGGRGLKIENFSMEEGVLHLSGEIDSFYYYDKRKTGEKTGFFARLLK